MTATTTLKVPEDLKARIVAAAKAARQTPHAWMHAWMLEALAAQASLSERRAEFLGSALVAREEVARYGLVFDADEVFAYLREKLDGKPASRPKAEKLGEEPADRPMPEKR